MITTILILIAGTFAGGALASKMNFQAKTIRYPLIFAGSFLFAITIIHILPEVFSLAEKPMHTGLYVLLGFFLQQTLEHFSAGIEHGHFHKGHELSVSSRFSVLIALMIHSLLEGALLTHDSPFHEQHESHSLLAGILFHKMPAAFALMTTFKGQGKFKVQHWLVLMLFSIASPVGLLLGGSWLHLTHASFMVLFAIVSGSFLHISTTIFVETSPNHNFGLTKLLIIALGAATAIASEFVF